MPKVSPIAPPATNIKAKVNVTPGLQPEPPKVPPVMTSEAKPGQPDAKETPAPEAKPLPPQYEALAKKESALRNRENELKAQQAAMDAKIKAAVDEALNQYRSKLKSQPLDVLNEEGLTYDQLVEQAINAPDPKTRSLEKQIADIKSQQDKLAEESRKAADAQRQAAIKQISYDVKDLVDNDAQYETIKGVGAYDDVVDLITRTFDETGRVLSVDKAAQLVENELFEEAKKIASLGKVKSALQPQLTPEMVKQQTKQIAPTTLTNEMSSKRPMTPRERAIARFKGEKF